jgi:hypothetical protein
MPAIINKPLGLTWGAPRIKKKLNLETEDQVYYLAKTRQMVGLEYVGRRLVFDEQKYRDASSGAQSD